jgi:hypothetical protein
MINLIDSFKQTMQNAGIEPPGEIIADGVLHRFTVTGDRSRSDTGWYVLHADDPAAGAFGCWKRGIAETWSSKACQVMTPAEKTAYTAKMGAMKRQREEERERIQAECRVWCADAWSKAKDATNEKLYLKRKGVNAYGLKSFKEHLLVSVQDMAGIMHGIQFITPDGTKKFKTGTNKTGHFFKIGKSKDKTVTRRCAFRRHAPFGPPTSSRLCARYAAPSPLLCCPLRTDVLCSRRRHSGCCALHRPKRPAAGSAPFQGLPCAIFASLKICVPQALRSWAPGF